jgi:Na+/melibiose symporter-like transporter
MARYFVVVAIGMWSWDNILIGAQAGTVECYPYKEERCQVEAFNVFFSAVGGAIAVCMMGVAYRYPLEALPALRNQLGLVCGGVGLLSMASALAVRDARQPCQPTAVPDFLTSFREVWASRAFRWLAAANAFESMSVGVVTANFLYYLRFVASLDDRQLSTAVVFVPVLGLLLQSLCSCFWGRLFAQKRQTPRNWTIGGRLLDALVTAVVMGSDRHIESFMLWFCCHRVLLSPRSFWAIAARGWVIDEDSFHVIGRRRESLFSGVLSAINRMALAMGSAVIVGQALAGIDTTQPRAFVQPASGVLYIRSLYIALVPALELAQAFCIYSFPIRGSRLDVLEREQGQSFRAVAR